MIQGIAKQTDSKSAHTRGWGCCAFVILAMWQDAHKELFAIAEIDAIIAEAIKRKIILDNHLPAIKGVYWYRCFVAEKEALFALVDERHGTKTIPCEIYRGPSKPRMPRATHTVLEERTRQGSHFELGEPNGNDFVPCYDPDPRVVTQGTRTVRHWEVRRA